MIKNKIIALIFILLSLNNVNAQNNKNNGKIVDKIIAVVGKNIILLSDIENQAKQLKAQGQYQKDLNCIVLEDLLYQKLLLDQAQKDSIEVTEREVDDNLDRRIRYFVSQIGSEKKLEDFYGKSIKQIKSEFREIIAKQMLTERMQNKLTGSLKVTPTEIRKFFNKIPKDSLPKINKQIILEQIVKYPPISEKEKLRIKEKLQNYRDRILKGEKFSTLAVLYSEDPGSARKGGELGFVGRTDLVPEFAAVAFKLKEPGDISRIVETSFGFHIIQLIEKRGELINVRHILLKPKISSNDLLKALNYMDSIRTLVLQKKIDFNKAAEKFSEDEASNKNGGLIVNPMTGEAVFEYSQLDPKTAYAIKNLKEGEISKTFKMQDTQGKDVFKIVKIKKIIPAHTASIKTDYQLIQNMCLADKKQKQIEQWIRKKQSITYIKIDPDYRKCPFKHKGWFK